MTKKQNNAWTIVIAVTLIILTVSFIGYLALKLVSPAIYTEKSNMLNPQLRYLLEEKPTPEVKEVIEFKWRDTDGKVLFIEAENGTDVVIVMEEIQSSDVLKFVRGLTS